MTGAGLVMSTLILGRFEIGGYPFVVTAEFFRNSYCFTGSILIKCYLKYSNLPCSRFS
jgi:hypothetical protein